MLMGGLFAVIFQPSLVAEVAKVPQLDFNAAYKGVMENMVTDTSIEMNNENSILCLVPVV